METLPVEMVERIVQQLTPQDLARCSAVSREWREIFNQDWIWKPHCDPEVEEPLQTIPCVATPAFVAPEDENSTLSPISRWKLAFMRENHLWRNWRRKEITNQKEKIIESKNYKIVEVDFLTDTLVVVWYSNRIEIFDVSVMPATLAAETDTTLNIKEGDHCRQFGPTVLFVKKDCSIEVFNVDLEDKSIKLKHNINFDSIVSGSYSAKGDFFVYPTDDHKHLIILNFNTGKTLKKEPCPVKNTDNGTIWICNVRSSIASDFVAVTVCVFGSCFEYFWYYIYSPKELTFLPGPVAHRMYECNSSLHGHWLALSDRETLTVLNIHTREVLLNYDEYFIHKNCIETYECYNGFLFWSDDPENSWVKLYSPSDRTLTTVYESPDPKSFEIIHNKFITIYNWHSSVLESVLKPSNHTIETCDISVTKGACKINRSCTKMLSAEWLNDSWTWVCSYLW